MPFNYLELITCQENRFYNIPVYCVGRPIARVSYDNNNSGIPYYFRAGRSDIDLCISEIWYPLGLFNALYWQAVKAFNQHIFNTFIINQAYNSHCPWAEIENQSLSLGSSLIGIRLGISLKGLPSIIIIYFLFLQRVSCFLLQKEALVTTLVLDNRPSLRQIYAESLQNV